MEILMLKNFDSRNPLNGACFKNWAFVLNFGIRKQCAKPKRLQTWFVRFGVDLN
jgi:hypothetical protein